MNNVKVGGGGGGGGGGGVERGCEQHKTHCESKLEGELLGGGGGVTSKLTSE